MCLLAWQGVGTRETWLVTWGRASLRPSHLQVISLAALRGWRLCSLDIKDAFVHADGFERNVSIQSPPEWLPGGFPVEFGR